MVAAYAPENLTALEATAVVLGAERRVILTHSPTLHAAQQVGFAQTLAKATGALTGLADKLARGKTRRARPKVEAEIEAICSPRWVARVIKTELTGQNPAQLRLAWHIDPGAQAGLETEKTSKPGSGRPRTPTWSRSPRSATSPTRRSGSTCSPACSPWRSPT